MAKSSKKSSGKAKKFKKLLAKSLNKGLVPVEYSYNTLVKVVEAIKKKTPAVYHEIDAVLKRNLVMLNRATTKKKDNLGEISNAITDKILGSVSGVDREELQKVVKSDASQNLIELIAKGLAIGPEQRKDITILEKEKTFKKVLIANRGEIALRVIRACRELGIEAVMIYTSPDRDSLAVKYADKAYHIGNSYLDIKKIIAVAKKANVNAIHPGYGFLAENAEFAKMCEQNKIKFIGPPSRAIMLLGDKVRAKHTARKVKVPIVEGTEKPVKDTKEARKMAEKIGFPIIFKAAAGGGGKGMRIVRSLGEVDQALISAQNEALVSFGDRSVFMEKYIEEPRHIEFQILASKFGNVIHLGERDCSIQRKHQKLIEESPSPFITEALRRKMGDASVRLTKAAKYEGAGTVEFLVDKQHNFYFIEMNTRIQVEHGVTEMVTGTDLVKEQIKLAAGAKLKYKQEDIKLEGCAIECRVNAEDPLDDFVPSTGTIINYLPPGGPGIRVNSVCRTGYTVSSDYDSLLSLLICHGSTRQEAISRMTRALKEYHIDGVKTTIPFHLTVFDHKRFQKGRFTTAFIEKHKILSLVKHYVGKEKKLTPDQRTIIVTTAVSKHLAKKEKQKKQTSAWAQAGRQELIENSEF